MFPDLPMFDRIITQCGRVMVMVTVTVFLRIIAHTAVRIPFGIDGNAHRIATTHSWV